MKQTKKSVQPIIKKLTVLLAVVLIGVGIAVVGCMKWNRDKMVKMKTTIVPEIVKKLDPSVTVKDITGFKQSSGLYEFELTLDVAGKEQKFTSYVTKDGKLFFTGGIKVSDLDKKPEVQGAEVKKVTCTDVTKKDKASLAVFVVADCPFGLQMQRVIKKALAEEASLSDYIQIKYIGAVENGAITSMHGDKEAQENLRQICIREEQEALFAPYLSCYMKEGKSDTCLSETKVNQTQLSACVADAKRGLAFAQKDFDLAAMHNVSGSPTLVVNDEQVVSEFDFGGRNVNALKDIVCCGSTTKPAFCTKTLSKDDVASSYSLTDEAAAGSSTAANCATN